MRTQWGIFLFIVVAGLVVFVFRRPGPWGNLAIVCATVLVATAGWLFGAWAGVFAGLAFALLNLLLPPGDWERFFQQGLAASLLLILNGAILGLLRRFSIQRDLDLTKQKQIEEALRESETRCKTLFEKNQSVMLLIDADTGDILDANPAACRFYGYSNEAMRAMKIGQINLLEGEALQHALNQAARLENTHFFFQHRLANGELREVESYVTPVQASGKNRLYSIVHDLTASRQIERSEREQRTQAEALRDTAAALTSTLQLDEVLERILNNIDKVVPHQGANILLIDKDQVITRVARSEGYDSKAREGKNKDTIQGESIYDIPGLCWMAKNKRPIIIPETIGNEMWRSYPESAWVRSYLGAPLYARGRLLGFLNLDSNVSGFYTEKHAERIAAFVDQAAIAIENAHLYAALQQQAVTDEGTKLYNRHGLFELGYREFDRSLRFHRPLSIIMLDIDHFKRVNDRYGHPVGDQVLRILADRCRQSVREVDIVARFGGEEFLILLVENDINTAATVAERLRKTVAINPFSTTAGNIGITISIGVSTINSDIADLGALIQRADQALYQAKNRGRNQVVLER